MYTVPKYRLSYVREPSAVAPRQISNKSDVLDFCRNYLSAHPIEIVCAISLDSSNNILGFEEFRGATNQCALYPANVFRFLLCSGACAVVIAHNHPGGRLNASEADWAITERLKEVGRLLEIPLVDHIIITDEGNVSLREHSRWNREQSK